MRLPASREQADPTGDRAAGPVTSFPAWPSSAGDLVELYPRNPSPTLRVNFIASADGAVTVGGLSGGLHGPGDKEIFDSLRMVCDALIVAAGTVQAENYDALRLTPAARQWRIAHGLPEFPLMVIVSGSLNLDPDQLIFSDAPIRPIVVTTTRADPSALTGIADVIAVGDDTVDCAAAVRELNARGAAQLLCEGGPHLFGALLDADLVDELCLTVSPLLVGGGPGRISSGAATDPRPMSLRHVLTLEDMLFLRYARQGS
ncbi:pyrimidine reductase family protein [Paractinoplanes hotanensis]|uniref:pyrimidine reductase family protein n=1 Tax=Paractinoplanes hotanensis TaxID=2906497 RepID=UPI0027E2C971|nr:pyrimidine reductase family protein [Actinoplanes hotanensis]